MTIPAYQDLFLPLLKLCADGAEHAVSSSADTLADQLNLSAVDRAQLLPSRHQRLLVNRVSWAKIYMSKALLLESSRRAFFRITERGRKLLESAPTKLDNAVLRQYPEFVKFLKDSRGTSETTGGEESAAANEAASAKDPHERFLEAYNEIRGTLASDLLQAIRGGTPEFFEHLVIDVLVAMGYGGSGARAGQHLGRSGDEGVDGVIKEDLLGLDEIYVQAKRWKEDNIVRRPEIQKFVGALQGKRAKKGIFITASTFTEEAREYTEGIDTKVILIDGPLLANLMFDHGVGVSKVKKTDSYEIKHLDSDYFAEE